MLRITWGAQGADDERRAEKSAVRRLRLVGGILAAGHHYFAHLNGAKQIVSALLAVLLWPLILFGVSLHIK